MKNWSKFMVRGLTFAIHDDYYARDKTKQNEGKKMALRKSYIDLFVFCIYCSFELQ